MSAETEVASDPKLVAAIEAALAGHNPRVFSVSPKPVAMDSTLRKHGQVRESLITAAGLAQIIGPELAVGVLGPEGLDPIVAAYVAERMDLKEPIRLYFTEPSRHTGRAVAGVVIVGDKLAWRHSQVPCERITSVAVQCDYFDKPYIELKFAHSVVDLPRLDPLPTVLLASVLARESGVNSYWLSPRACRFLRRGVHAQARQLSKTAAGDTLVGKQARIALDLIQPMAETISRIYIEWELLTARQYNNYCLVPPESLLDICVAPEFHEVREQMSSAMQDRLLMRAHALQSQLGAQEGLIAMFDFRKVEIAQAMSEETFATPDAHEGEVQEQAPFAGCGGVLTSDRLLVCHPRRGVILSVPLGNLRRLFVREREAPMIECHYVDEQEQSQLLWGYCSGSFLYPLAAEPIERARKLADRVVEAQARFWQRQRRRIVRPTAPLMRDARQPAAPRRATGPTPVSKRRATVAMPFPAAKPSNVPRIERQVAAIHQVLPHYGSASRRVQLGDAIDMHELRTLRENLEQAGIGMSGVGQRVAYFPAKCFTQAEAGVLLAEHAVLIGTAEPARFTWKEIRNVENIAVGKGAQLTIYGAERSSRQYCPSADVSALLAATLTQILAELETAGCL